jgi:hypothetical protein
LPKDLLIFYNEEFSTEILQYSMEPLLKMWAL